MALYLVDYENVNSSGMKGLDHLTENDEIYLFYCPNSNTMSFSLHNSICSSKAKIEFLNCSTGGKNSLEFQIATLLGFLIAKNGNSEYIIVSKDTGFTSVVAFWLNRKVKIMLANNLLKENQNTNENVLLTALPNFKSDFTKILSIINKLKTKQGINNALVKEFGDDKAETIYKAIKPLLTDKKVK